MTTRLNTLLLAVALLTPFGATAAQVSLSITVAPPPLPYYAQPQPPGDNYLWMPGYWAWSPDDEDYHWVPGTWVLAPGPGELWTPGYWAFEGNGFFWHIGYWGRAVGFYGGVNYGYGYSGSGYQGGHWDRGRFVRSPAVSERGRRGGSVSFQGGRGGSGARPPNPDIHPRPNEHRAPSDAQMQHEYAAVTRPAQRATGAPERPLVAATPRPLAFEAPGVEHARPGPAHGRGNRPEPRERGQSQQPDPRGQPGPEHEHRGRPER